MRVELPVCVCVCVLNCTSSRNPALPCYSFLLCVDAPKESSVTTVKKTSDET